jgi:hypothetical protein
LRSGVQIFLNVSKLDRPLYDATAIWPHQGEAMSVTQTIQALIARRSTREAIIGLIAACISSAITVCVVRWTDGVPLDWHLTSETLAHFATAIGVTIAGVWAFYTTYHRRSLAPRAELNHQYQLWSQQNNDVLRIFIELRNPSEAMMVPGDGMTYVQIPPTNSCLPSDYATDAWISIAKLRHPIVYEEMHIDPKEVEVFIHDIPLPIGTRYVQVHSWIYCESIDQGDSGGGKRPVTEIERPNEHDTWAKTTLIDLDAIRSAGQKIPSVRRFARQGPQASSL